MNLSKNRNQENDQQCDDVPQFFDFNLQEETMVVPLKENLFLNLSWTSAFDYINEASDKREILGLIPVKSNLIWRFFLSILKQRSNIKQLRQQRVVELKNLIQKLDQLQNDEGKGKRQQQIQDIYDKLKKVQTNGNPLTNMMARNLKVFIKIYAEVKRKSKRELDNVTEALMMDQKMAELEKQNLESRIFILGANKPNLYFNTHARVYEKTQIQPITNLNIFNNTSSISNNIILQQQYNSRMQDSQFGNNQSVNSALLSTSNALNKQKIQYLQQQNNQSYNTINSQDNNNNSSQEHQNKSLIDIANQSNQKSNSKAQKISNKNGSNLPIGASQSQLYGRKKQSNTGLVQAVVGAQSGVASADTASSTVMCNFSSQSSAILSRRKTASRGGGEPNNQPEENISRRSNQSSQDQNQRYLSTRLLN